MSGKELPKFKQATKASVLVRRGDHPFEALEVPAIQVDGAPAVVYLKKPSMKTLMEKIDQVEALKKAAGGDEAKISVEAQRVFSNDILRLCVVDENGEPMFAGPGDTGIAAELPDVTDLQPDVYEFLTDKATEFLGLNRAGAGKAPSEASGVASPTDLPSPSVSQT